MDAVPDVSTLLLFFKALANDSRLRLLGLVAQREHSVQELAERLGLTEPTASHHLALLKRIGLVRMRPDGNTHWYALDAAALAGLARSVLSREQVAALAPDAAPGTEADRVLRSFVAPDGTLTSIPAVRKKRRVVLAWLAQQFEPDRPYPEAEVDSVIQRRHWDSATLRRELVGYRMMARDGSIYRRLPDAEWQAG